MIIDKAIERMLVAKSVEAGIDFCDALFYPEQVDIYERYKVMKTNPLLTNLVVTFSRKSGKTFTMMAIAFWECIRNPEFNCFVLAPTREQIKKYIEPIIFELKQFLPKEIADNIEYKNKRVVFKMHGVEERYSNIWIDGADFKEGDGLRGPKSNLVIIDEAGFYKADLEYIMQSVINPMVQFTNGKILICSTPPTSITHKYCKIASEAEMEGQHIKKTIYDLTVYKAPGEIEKVIKSCKGKHTIAFRREYMCEFITDPSKRIIPEFNEIDHPLELSEMPAVPEYYQPYACIDWGFNHNTGIVFGYLDFELGKFIVQDEIWIKAISTGELAKLIRHKENHLWGEYFRRNSNFKVIRYGDNDLQLCKDMTTDHGIHIAPIKKIGLDATVNQLRNRIGSHFIVSPKCKNLRYQLLNGCWDDNRKKFEETRNVAEHTEEDLNGHCDNIAALMYLNRFIEWRKNPFPSTYINKETIASKTSNKIMPKRDNSISRSIFKIRKFE